MNRYSLSIKKRQITFLSEVLHRARVYTASNLFTIIGDNIHLLIAHQIEKSPHVFLQFLDPKIQQMSTAQHIRPRSALSPQYINGIYIPSALLIVGVAIVKKDWLPYAAVVALILGSWKVYNNRKSSSFDSGFPIVKMGADT